jgi:hypothetical protein
VFLFRHSEFFLATLTPNFCAAFLSLPKEIRLTKFPSPEMSGLSIPAASKMSITLSLLNASSTICLMAVSISKSDLPVPVPSNFTSLAFTA